MRMHAARIVERNRNVVAVIGDASIVIKKIFY